MLMQVLTCNSKIKLDATFALPGTNDCNGVEGRRSSRALSTARCEEVHVLGQNDRTIYRSERRCCSCPGGICRVKRCSVVLDLLDCSREQFIHDAADLSI
jgi:hypothetical protein